MNQGVFASTFPDLSGSGEQLWLLVNRANTKYTGGQLFLPPEPSKMKHSITKSMKAITSYQYFDCWRGDTLTIINRIAEFVLEARGFGCVLRTQNTTVPESPLKAFLKTMKSLSARGPLPSFSRDYHFLMQQIVPIARTKPSSVAPDTV